MFRSVQTGLRAAATTRLLVSAQLLQVIKYLSHLNDDTECLQKTPPQKKPPLPQKQQVHLDKWR